MIEKIGFLIVNTPFPDKEICKEIFWVVVKKVFIWPEMHVACVPSVIRNGSVDIRSTIELPLFVLSNKSRVKLEPVSPPAIIKVQQTEYTPSIKTFYSRVIFVTFTIWGPIAGLGSIRKVTSYDFISW